MNGRKVKVSRKVPEKKPLFRRCGFPFLVIYYRQDTDLDRKEGCFMDAQERRQAVARRLEEARDPVSAAALAREFSVSRQIIVGDVALLRAGGMDIAATPRGYVLPEQPAGLVRTLACRHNGEQMEAELNAIVDQGCTVIDVIVDHPIYGQLTGALNLSNRYEVGQFISRCQEYSAVPLSLLTEGIHLHTVLCPSQEAFDRVREALGALGVLLED